METDKTDKAEEKSTHPKTKTIEIDCSVCSSLLTRFMLPKPLFTGIFPMKEIFVLEQPAVGRRKETETDGTDKEEEEKSTLPETKRKEIDCSVCSSSFLTRLMLQKPLFTDIFLTLKCLRILFIFLFGTNEIQIEGSDFSCLRLFVSAGGKIVSFRLKWNDVSKFAIHFSCFGFSSL
ncbi:hypothetical protein CDAR_3441 [Caerostris darwini]|uniref:Uncharacterized protein n=1 Tax=Caerostris darwini TaxID=1538125 RepID=A0AAV4QUN0_9ARAC|nr:hypothetical protein CDAR_3441 [Caerostris darwini]